MKNKNLIKIIGCESTSILAEKIADSLGVNTCNTSIVRFSDGEFEPSFDETIRGCNVFLVQTTIPPAENLMELLLMIDAAKRASAYKIVAVVPYFGYARQDKKGKPRVPIGAKLVANLLMAAGVDRIMTMDLHADQIQGFFEVPVDHLYASSLFVPYVQSLNLKNIIVASPDMGGTKRANTYANFLNSQVVVCYKHREKANEISKMMIIGEVKNKNVILVDDMIDTGGTLTKAADIMISDGALSVRAICTHGLFTSNAYKKIDNSKITEVVVTDTIVQRHESKKIKVISTADIFARTIDAVMKKKSITKNFLI